MLATRRLVGFIAGTPHPLRIRRCTVASLDINFLCVHKKLRDRRLAPVLIREITRRFSQEGVIRVAHLYTAASLIHSR